MSDLNTRLGRLEAHTAGVAEQIEVIRIFAGESAEDIWGRDHPGEAYPTNAFIVSFVNPKRGANDGRT